MLLAKLVLRIPTLELLLLVLDSTSERSSMFWLMALSILALLSAKSTLPSSGIFFRCRGFKVPSSEAELSCRAILSAALAREAAVEAKDMG